MMNYLGSKVEAEFTHSVLYLVVVKGGHHRWKNLVVRKASIEVGSITPCQSVTSEFWCKSLPCQPHKNENTGHDVFIMP